METIVLEKRRINKIKKFIKKNHGHIMALNALADTIGGLPMSPHPSQAGPGDTPRLLAAAL